MDIQQIDENDDDSVDETQVSTTRLYIPPTFKQILLETFLGMVLPILICIGIGMFLGNLYGMKEINQTNEKTNTDTLTVLLIYHDLIKITAEGDYTAQFSSWSDFSLKKGDQLLHPTSVLLPAVAERYRSKERILYVLDFTSGTDDYQIVSPDNEPVAMELTGKGRLGVISQRSAYDLDFGKYYAEYPMFVGMMLGFIVGLFLAILIMSKIIHR